MNYQEYRESKEKLNLENYLRYDCMNIYKSLEPLLDEEVYKHLENLYKVDNKKFDDFLENFNYKTSLTKEKHVNMKAVKGGVVQSLKTIFESLKEEEFLIPSDVYPVYLQLAEDEGLNFETYQAFLGTDYGKLTDAKNKVVLITYPCKPIEVNVTYDQIKTLNENGCTVVLDCVYMRDGKDYLLDEILSLGNVIVLHSMSKTFLRPKKIGIVIDTTNKNINYINASEEDIKEANDLINLVNMNKILEKIITVGWEKQSQKYIEIDKEMNSNYFKLSKGNYEDLLSKGVLTIPVSVFGIKKEGYVLVTPLLFLSDQLKKLKEKTHSIF